MKKNLLLKLFLDIIIPLLGYFVWKWDCAFILLFYLLEWILSAIVLIFKIVKRKKHIESKVEFNQGKLFLTISGLAFFKTILMFYFLLPMIESTSFDWKQRSIDFLMYSDIGLPQCVLLIPLLYLSARMKFKMEYLLSKRYVIESSIYPMRVFMLESILIVSISAVFFVLAFFVSYPSEIILFATIALCSLGRMIKEM